MKFTLVLLAALTLIAASPVDVDERADVNERSDVDVDEREAPPATLEARDFKATANPPWGVTLKCRSGAATSYKPPRKEYNKGDSVNIKCQTSGENIHGNSVWNKINRRLARDCYVSDYYTSTGHIGFIPDVPRCSG